MDREPEDQNSIVKSDSAGNQADADIIASGIRAESANVDPALLLIYLGYDSVSGLTE